MNIDFLEQRSAASFISMYAKGGASPQYALPTAKAVCENPELFSHVTGAHLAMLENRGVPIAYVVAAFAAGFKVFEVIQLWNDGMPLEYVTAFGAGE